MQNLETGGLCCLFWWKRQSFKGLWVCGFCFCVMKDQRVAVGASRDMHADEKLGSDAGHFIRYSFEADEGMDPT